MSRSASASTSTATAPSSSELKAESALLPRGWVVGWSKSHSKRFWARAPTASLPELKQWHPPRADEAVVLQRAAPVESAPQPLPVRHDSDDDDAESRGDEKDDLDDLLATMSGVKIAAPAPAATKREPPSDPRSKPRPVAATAARPPAPAQPSAVQHRATAASHASQPSAASLAISNPLNAPIPVALARQLAAAQPAASAAQRAPPPSSHSTSPSTVGGLQLPRLSADSLNENPYLSLPVSQLEENIRQQSAFVTSSAAVLAQLPDKGANFALKIAQFHQAMPIALKRERVEKLTAAAASAAASSAHQPLAGSLRVDFSRLPSSPAAPAAAFGSTPDNAHALFGRSNKIQTLSMDAARDYLPSTHSSKSARGMQHGFHALSSYNANAGVAKKDAVDESDLADLLKSLHQMSVVETKAKSAHAAAASSASSAIDPAAAVTLAVPGLRSSTRLLPHQVHAVRWMQRREDASSEPRGGLIADDCGLGKTLQMIALILLGLESDVNLPAIPRSKHASASSPIDLAALSPSHATLLICPKAVLNSWVLELEKHTDPAWRLQRFNRPLRVLVYHGAEKKKWADSRRLANSWDVVLTTYETAMRERGPERRGKKEQKESESDGSDDDEEEHGSDFGLMGVYWRRIVLDESHHVRNAKSETCKALCTRFECERRWCMSGTPLQNAVDDLFSTFWFLRFAPYADASKWKSLVSRHAGGERKGLEVLKTLLCVLALRRSKADRLPDGRPLVQLPPKHFDLHRLDFSPREKQFYEELWNGYREELKSQFGGASKPSKAGSSSLLSASHKATLSMSDLLVKLLRLRQCCDHFLLAVEGMRLSAKKDGVRRERSMEDAVEQACRKIQLKAKQQERQQESKRNAPSDSDSDADDCCGICFDPLPSSPARVLTTRCEHSFCAECLSPLLLDSDEIECPTCDKEVTLKQMKKQLEVAEQNAASSQEDAMTVDFVESLAANSASATDLLATTKITFLLSQLRAIKSNAATASDRVIVFSQWTSMLDLIQIALDKDQAQAERERANASYHYTRLDGSQSSKQQHANLTLFQDSNPLDLCSPSVFLISLKAGGTGLNLTSANHVFLLDLWWNPGVEVQAFDRVYRVGQTKPVHIHKLIIRDSVEETLYEMQQKKLAMAHGVLDAERRGGAAADSGGLGFKKGKAGMSLAELREIFLGKGAQ